MGRRQRRRQKIGLRQAQEQMRELNDRTFRDRGPVTSLPVPAGNAERITAAELEEDAQ